MSRFARRGCHDVNHAEVAQYYRDLGCSVADTSAAGFGVPDLAIGCAGVTTLVEIKDADGDISQSQKHFMQTWRGGPIAVVRSLDEAIDHVKRIRALLRSARSIKPNGESNV